MMKGTVERGTGQAAKALGRPVAAKTGTTNDYSNAWFIGFTPTLATGVWVGYDRPRSLGKDETGSRVAVPIWTAFMKEALAGKPVEDFPIPEGVVVVPIDLSLSGTCARPVPMAFLAGTEPKGACGPARGSVKVETAADQAGQDPGAAAAAKPSAVGQEVGAAGVIKPQSGPEPSPVPVRPPPVPGQ